LSNLGADYTAKNCSLDTGGGVGANSNGKNKDKGLDGLEKSYWDIIGSSMGCNMGPDELVDNRVRVSQRQEGCYLVEGIYNQLEHYQRNL
jgi:hypothetical protein